MTQAIILFSGGLDSTVMLAYALSKGISCRALSFDYGQTHKIELEAAAIITSYYQVPHHIIPINPNSFGDTPLLSGQSNNLSHCKSDTSKILSTYVPARNTLFLSFALAFCEQYMAHEIHIGANLADLEGYPDCRPEYFLAFQNLINLATKQSVENHPPQLITPLISMDKHAIIELGMRLKAPLELSWSCYFPNKNKKPCQICTACLLRAEGFKINL